MIADSVDGLAAAVARIESISRVECRREFDRRFTVASMVDRYEEVYHKLIGLRYAAATLNGR
jgi:hypothetical protein